jgi:hypothetical protein
MAVPYSFFEVYLAVHPKDLPSGRPQVRDRHLKFHEDRDNLVGGDDRAYDACGSDFG